MNWLRNNEPADGRSDRGWRTLRLPMPGVCLRRRRPDVEDSVNWLRNNELSRRTSTSPLLRFWTNLGNTMPKGKLTPRKEEGH
jgi:hypothetical protein